MNILEFRQWKKEGRKISMVTCYDSWSAKILNTTDVDLLLVGDSAAMVMHGHDDTLPATIDMLVPHVAAVRKAAPKKLVIGDLPFLSFRSDLASNMEAVRRLMQAGAQAIKLEGYDQKNHEWIQHLVESGIPVMGHLGLTPQFVNAFGGFRVQGRGEDQAQKILAQARGLQEAGCFSLVLEGVPSGLASEITASLQIPTIGIGAGPGCDGQVLVLQDLLGLTVDFKPRFVRHYLNGSELIQKAVNSFCADVTGGKFPSQQESYE